ncbi:HEAT repeat domain-containing protein [Streptomyces sp. NBC_00091]|uniref:HEAT repeat domain-containing protein n=1 Tax=Streptomyces sp. NBC_00091 TaxID=2975648 RepID=UPI0022551001|nr:HEAT repeat domain-containing protein [Streptomyces sp. NBC_00091]MCX5380491.1 HEAT repeat domain-containing protein [Streptomyces sp. NBC_00091]
MSDALAGLDAVEWTALSHAYGPAGDVPGMLADLYRPEKAADAADDLFMAVHHQGGAVCSAAPAALPYVLGAAAAPGVDPAVRLELLELVGALAHTAHTAQPRYVTPAWPAAWDLAVTELLPLLEDPAAEIRTAVADALAEARHRADEVITALRARWAEETEPQPQRQLANSVGSLIPHADEHRDSSLDWLRRLMDGAAEPSLRLAAVKALRDALPGHDDPAYARTVSEVLSGSEPATWQPGGAAVKPTVVWGIGLLADDRTARAEATGRLLAHPDPAVRAGALQVAAEELSRRRSAVPELLPAVARLLTDPEPDNRLFAARVLGMCGHAAHPWADALAAMVTDEGEPYPPAQSHAVWALSRLGDARCVPPLVRRLSGERLGLAYNSTHASGWWTYELSLTEVAEGLGAHADALLPVVRARLTAASSPDERRELCQLLEAWGAPAAPAIPELLGLLDTDAAVWALDALAAIGPAAAGAAPRERLRALLDAPPEGQPFAPRRLALAYGRLTGDREPALALLLPLLGEPYGQDNPAALLGELGPAAEPYLPRLRELLTLHTEGWLPLRVGEAMWRITGAADEVVPVLVRAIAPFAERGGAYRAVTETVAFLAEIGPPAACAAPVLKAFLDADERPVPHGGWRSVPEDDALRAAAHAALRATAGPPPPPR